MDSMALSGWRNSCAMVCKSTAGDEDCVSGTAATVCTPVAELIIIVRGMLLGCTARTPASQAPVAGSWLNLSIGHESADDSGFGSRCSVVDGMVAGVHP